MSKTKNVFLLIRNSWLLVVDIIKMSYDQWKTNRQAWKEIRQDLYFQNKSILLWEKGDEKRFRLFVTSMEMHGDEMFKLLNESTDKQIEKMYLKDFGVSGLKSDDWVVKKGGTNLDVQSREVSNGIYDIKIKT